MLCQFERLLYPKNISGMQLGSYMIALYRPCERVVDGGGNRVMQIKAVGYGLPTASSLRYDIPNFYDLRNFKLTKKEFVVCYKTQLILASIYKRKNYYKEYDMHQFEATKHLSAELQMFLMERGDI